MNHDVDDMLAVQARFPRSEVHYSSDSTRYIVWLRSHGAPVPEPGLTQGEAWHNARVCVEAMPATTDPEKVDLPLDDANEDRAFVRAQAYGHQARLVHHPDATDGRPYVVVLPAGGLPKPGATPEEAWSNARVVADAPPSPNDPEPDPVATEEPATWDLVIADMRERDRMGEAKYGVRLQPGNGRNHLVDAYQECLDQAVYLRNEIERQEWDALDAIADSAIMDAMERFIARAIAYAPHLKTTIEYTALAGIFDPED